MRVLFFGMCLLGFLCLGGCGAGQSGPPRAVQRVELGTGHIPDQLLSQLRQDPWRVVHQENDAVGDDTDRVARIVLGVLEQWDRDYDLRGKRSADASYDYGRWLTYSGLNAIVYDATEEEFLVALLRSGKTVSNLALVVQKRTGIVYVIEGKKGQREKGS